MKYLLFPTTNFDVDEGFDRDVNDAENTDDTDNDRDKDCI